MTTFSLPDLGEGLQEAEIVTWHVEVGNDVVADQPLLAVETDKAVVEIPSPRTGRIAALRAAAGDVVAIGAALVDFEDSEVSDSGVIVGALAEEAVRLPDHPLPAAAAHPGAVKAAPAVRALARKHGLDLDAVLGTGPDGSITLADVAGLADGGPDGAPGEPLRGVRRAMARKMAQSHAEVVPTTVIDEADVDAWPAGTDVTIRIVQAIAAACRAVPALNAWYDSARESRRILEPVDLGIAAHTDDGLFVPVLRNVAGRDAADLRRGLDAMKRAAQARDFPPAELRGASITLSNFGIFGAGRHAALVVMPPQVAILGTGRVAPGVVAVDGKPAVRRLIKPLSLTFDHRVVNGGEAASFLAAIIERLERATDAGQAPLTRSGAKALVSEGV